MAAVLVSHCEREGGREGGECVRESVREGLRERESEREGSVRDGRLHIVSVLLFITLIQSPINQRSWSVRNCP